MLLQFRAQIIEKWKFTPLQFINMSDEIGMDESNVKLTDLMDSLDLLRSHEKKSSEVLTKLSHRLDTTDFANAFNVTSEYFLFLQVSDPGLWHESLIFSNISR